MDSSATVKRQLPGVIFIQLMERQPVALWQHHQRHYLVDEQGVIISSDNLQGFARLPIIVGGDAWFMLPYIGNAGKFDIRKSSQPGEGRGTSVDLHLTNFDDQVARIK